MRGMRLPNPEWPQECAECNKAIYPKCLAPNNRQPTRLGPRRCSLCTRLPRTPPAVRMTTLAVKTAYDTATLTSRTALETARAAALELVQAINPSITLTPLTFTGPASKLPPKHSLYYGMNSGRSMWRLLRITRCFADWAWE